MIQVFNRLSLATSQTVNADAVPYGGGPYRGDAAMPCPGRGQAKEPERLQGVPAFDNDQVKAGGACDCGAAHMKSGRGDR
jgi:hypothetical protein